MFALASSHKYARRIEGALTITQRQMLSGYDLLNRPSEGGVRGVFEGNLHGRADVHAHGAERAL